jgi:hypothetical protein
MLFVRAQAQPSRQSCRRSLKTDIAELPDWLAAVKRIDAAATFDPANDDWPVANAKAIAVGSSQSGRYIRSASRNRATSTRLDTGCTLRGS